jgi:hypothetical protein
MPCSCKSRGLPQALWKKLTSIHSNKGAQFEEYLLGKLQTARYAESEDMCTHLTTMNTLHEHLAEIGSPISDIQFTYIRTTLSLITHYQSLLMTLSTTAHQMKTALTSDDLIWHLIEEANTIKLEANMNKAHAVLAAAHGNPTKGHPKVERAKTARERERSQYQSARIAS